MNNFLLATLLCFSFMFSPSTLNLDSKVYSKLGEILNIEEYGMKIAYFLEGSIKEELDYIKSKSYFKNSSWDIKEREAYLKIDEKNISLEISLIEEEKNLRGEIVINSKGRINIEEIKKNFHLFHNKNIENMNFYTYIKGDIRENNNIDEIEGKILEAIGKDKVKEKQSISLDKGTTGIINLKSDYQFNYSIMTYEKGRKLIIGTPIIFTTY